MILKRHKNELYNAIQRFGLNPGDFRPTEEWKYDRPAFTLQYKESPFTFSVFGHETDFDSFGYSFTVFRRGFPQWEVNYNIQKPFSDVVDALEGWAQHNLARYIEEETIPDFWAQLSETGDAFGDVLAQPLDNTPFTESEKHKIKLALQRFRQSIDETFQPSEEASAVVAERLDYLAQAVDRLNKTDWRGIAVSTVIGIATTLGLDTEKGRLLFGLLQQAFTAAWHLLSP